MAYDQYPNTIHNAFNVFRCSFDYAILSTPSGEMTHREVSEWVKDRESWSILRRETRRKKKHRIFINRKCCRHFVSIHIYSCFVYDWAFTLWSWPCRCFARLQRMHAVDFLFLIFLPQFLLLFAQALPSSVSPSQSVSTSVLLLSVSRFRFRSIDMKSWQGPYEIELGNIISSTV